jgi:hypothetical protein
VSYLHSSTYFVSKPEDIVKPSSKDGVFTQISDKADREMLDRTIRAAVDSKQPYHLEYRIVRADGAVDVGKRQGDLPSRRVSFVARWSDF